MLQTCGLETRDAREGARGGGAGGATRPAGPASGELIVVPRVGWGT